MAGALPARQSAARAATAAGARARGRWHGGIGTCVVPLQLLPQMTACATPLALTAPMSTAAAAGTGFASPMRRAVHVLCLTLSGNLTELRIPITTLKDESRLHMRELLVVEQPAALLQPRILPRRHCIVLTIGYVRAIVWTDRVYLFSPGMPQVQAYARSLQQHLTAIYGSSGGGDGGGGSSGGMDAAAIRPSAAAREGDAAVVASDGELEFDEGVLAGATARASPASATRDGAAWRDPDTTLEGTAGVGRTTTVADLASGIIARIRAGDDAFADVGITHPADEHSTAMRRHAAAQGAGVASGSGGVGDAATEPPVEARGRGGSSRRDADFEPGTATQAGPLPPRPGGLYQHAEYEDAAAASASASSRQYRYDDDGSPTAVLRLGSDDDAALQLQAVAEEAAHVSESAHRRQAGALDALSGSRPTGVRRGRTSRHGEHPSPPDETPAAVTPRVVPRIRAAGAAAESVPAPGDTASPASAAPSEAGVAAGDGKRRDVDLAAADCAPRTPLPPDVGGSGAAAAAGDATQTAFELVVMEHALLTLQARQAKRVAYARQVLESVLSKMETVQRDDSRLYALFPLANTLTHYEMVSRGLTECVRALLDDDRDMRESCLSEKARISSLLARQAAEAARVSAAVYGSAASVGGATAAGSDDAGASAGHSAPGAIASHGQTTRPLHLRGDVEATLTPDSGGAWPTPQDASERRGDAAATPTSPGRSEMQPTARTPVAGAMPSEAAIRHAAAFDLDPETDRLPRLALHPAPANASGGGGSFPASAVQPLSRRRAPDDDADSPPAAGAAPQSTPTPYGAPFPTGAAAVPPYPYGPWPWGWPPHFANAAPPPAPPLPLVQRVSQDALSALELMLESVFHRSAETTMHVVELSKTLQAKRDLLELQQSNYRNFILSVSLRMSVLSVAVASGTFLTSAFGMNVPSGLESVPLAFYAATAASAGIGMYVFRVIDRHVLQSSPTQKYARRLQTFQQFLLKLDTKVDAVKDVLTTAHIVPPDVGERQLGNGAPSRLGSGPTRPLGFGGRSRLLVNEYSPDFDRATAAGVHRGSGSVVGGGGAGEAGRAATGGTDSSSGGGAYRPHHRLGTVLTKAEFKALHENTTGKTLSDEEVDLMFELLDVNNDGALQLEEVVAMFQKREGGSAAAGGGAYESVPMVTGLSSFVNGGAGGGGDIRGAASKSAASARGGGGGVGGGGPGRGGGGDSGGGQLR